jgi:hypothetical protein
MNLWSWHAGKHALVTPVVTEQGKVSFLAFPLTFLQRAGWQVTEEGFRLALPRFDEGPKLATSAKDADIQAAAAMEHNARGLLQRIRRGA